MFQTAKSKYSIKRRLTLKAQLFYAFFLKILMSPTRVQKKMAENSRSETKGEFKVRSMLRIERERNAEYKQPGNLYNELV